MTGSPANPAPIPTPPVTPGSPERIQHGLLVPPIQLVRQFSPDAWEEFIQEWAHSRKAEYRSVGRPAGAGDKGLDIVGYVGDPSGPDPWDNYQCKHYDHPLYPSDIWLELGKLCYYTFTKEYTVPRRYRFVAPQDVGTALSKLLRSPAKLRAGLIAKWDESCKTGITSTVAIPLDPPLKQHIDAFDFGIVGYIPVLEVIEQHSKTPWYVFRFGGGLPPRPTVPAPPPAATDKTARYVGQMMEAYGEHLRLPTMAVEDLPQHPKLEAHFQQQRVCFYYAEALRNFSRDHLPPGEFEKLQDEICDGVVDTVHAKHADGYERLLQTVRAAREMQITGHCLVTRLHTNDRAGVCHQLANDDRVKWVAK